MGDDTQKQDSRVDPLRGGLLLIITLIMIRNAWMSDDAQIIIRTVDNLANGLGLTWNVSERVQTFTCPLWTLLLAPVYTIAREGYYSTVVLSLIISVYTVYLIATRIAATTASAVLTMLVLLFSRAFIDYSTSGLENPLTHLLITVYFLRITNDHDIPFDTKSVFYTSVVFGLLMLNRLDMVLLIGPCHLYLLLKSPGRLKRFGIAALGISPVLCWFLFSMAYYGFPFPNTAYAKLSMGLPAAALWIQGIHYLKNSLLWDPITLSSLTVALLGTIVSSRPRNTRLLLFCVGVMLHLVYVIRIGGDHMAGRFLSPVFIVGANLLAAWPIARKPPQIALALLFIVLGFMSINPTLLFKRSFKKKPIDSAGIADEREFYFTTAGLYHQSIQQTLVNNYLGDRGTRHQRTGPHSFVNGHLGLVGYFVGPEIHIIDPVALTDPLLARLPIPYANHWRTGHYARPTPPGYPAAIEGNGALDDPDLNVYYSHLKNIITGSVWRMDRFKDIVLINLGAFDHLKERFIVRSVGIKAYKTVCQFKRADAVPWDKKGNILLAKAGIGIHIPERRWKDAQRYHAKFSVSLAGGGDYDVLYLSDGEIVATDQINLSHKPKGVLHTHVATPPKQLMSSTIDLIRFRPKDTFGRYSFGHFRFESGSREVGVISLTRDRNGTFFHHIPRILSDYRDTSDKPCASPLAAGLRRRSTIHADHRR